MKRKYERRPGICCANCLRYDTCCKTKDIDGLCASWTGSYSLFKRKRLEEKRRGPVKEERKKMIRKNALMWTLGALFLAAFFLVLGIVGNMDLKTELKVPDEVSLQEYLEEME